VQGHVTSARSIFSFLLFVLLISRFPTVQGCVFIINIIHNTASQLAFNMIIIVFGDLNVVPNKTLKLSKKSTNIGVFSRVLCITSC